MNDFLFQKIKRNSDYCVRCYLTLACDSQCDYCSAQVNQASLDRRAETLEPTVWAEGLNRRARHTILAGGEPFLYAGFADLIAQLEPTYKVEIYTNLNHPIDEFLYVAGPRKFPFLISLHPSADRKAWLERVNRLAARGHHLRFHIVRAAGFTELTAFLESSGIVGRFQTALQGDQRAGPKSAGPEVNQAHPWVRCISRIYLFGPDGHRYHCVHKMIGGDPEYRVGSIQAPDTPIETQLYCDQFGLCAGCDNNIEGHVEDVKCPG